MIYNKPIRSWRLPAPPEGYYIFISQGRAVIVGARVLHTSLTREQSFCFPLHCSLPSKAAAIGGSAEHALGRQTRSSFKGRSGEPNDQTRQSRGFKELAVKGRSQTGTHRAGPHQQLAFPAALEGGLSSPLVAFSRKSD